MDAVEHAQAGAGARRDARDRRDHHRRVPQAHREGRRLWSGASSRCSIDEPSVEETIEILNGLRDRYEAFHRVRITDEAIVAAAELSDRYIARPLPARQGHRPDRPGGGTRAPAHEDQGRRTAARWRTSCARLERERDQAVAGEDYERANDAQGAMIDGSSRPARGSERETVAQRAPEVTAEDIAEVVSRATGIPVSQLTQEERERLLELESQLHERVRRPGRGRRGRGPTRSAARGRGWATPTGRSARFLFLGPTGVGKTELARALAEFAVRRARTP